MSLFCALSFAGAGFSAQSEKVRVGFFAFDGYHDMDSSGRRSGYGYDLLQHLARYADWSFEYIGYDKSWQEMQDMLERGESEFPHG